MKRNAAPTPANWKYGFLAVAAVAFIVMAVVLLMVLTSASRPVQEPSVSSPTTPPPSSSSPTPPPQLVVPPQTFTAKPTPSPTPKPKPSKPPKTKKPKPSPKPTPTPPPLPATTFKVGSFNVLGCSHTEGKEKRRGFKPCAARSPGQVQMVREAALSVVGLQEFQAPQRRQWQNRLPNWGFSWGQPDANAVAWDKAVWTFVRADAVQGKYFGGSRAMYPQVLLKHNETGREVWFISVHNPADTHGNAEHLRSHNTQVQGNHVNDLRESGTPVIFTGDMNDREDFACPYSRLSSSLSADGTHWADGACRPTKVWIDQIMGTLPISWSEFSNNWASKDRRLTDHPLVVATAEIPPPAA